MNENVYLDGVSPFKNATRDYGSIPTLDSVEDILLQESISSTLCCYTIATELFDKFLSERFGYNIQDFRQLYSKEHASLLNIDVNALLALAQHMPLPDNIRAYFAEVNSSFGLMFKYEQCKELVNSHCCPGKLPLHNNAIANFTIIRACFSQLGAHECLENLKNNSSFGYYVSTEKFRFFISSSMQLDITIVYEEI